MDVVGLRTPTGEMSSPESALNNDDFPLPVEPASATTVCSPERRSRSSARAEHRPGTLQLRGLSDPAVESLDRLVESLEHAGKVGPAVPATQPG